MGEEVPVLLDDLVTLALARQVPTREQALALLESEDDDLLDVVAAAGRVRRHFFANRVKLNLIVNMKSGLCPEEGRSASASWRVGGGQPIATCSASPKRCAPSRRVTPMSRCAPLSAS